jgi:pimeloyl-ACP methyl ester carboxylesterase
VGREEVTFDSGGLRCAAWLYRPDEEGPHAIVVLGHGFTGVRDMRLDAYAERFRDAGLAALVFDYRHFGDSEGEPRQLLDVERQLEDWASAIAFARSLDGIDAKRVALWGTSFGGGHAAEAGVRDGRVAAVVSQCAFADGVAQLRHTPLRTSLALTLAALRDAARALRGAEPHYAAAVGEPGDTAAMTAEEALPGMRSLLPEGSKWENRFTPRMFLGLPRYRPFKDARSIHCPWLVCVCRDDATAPPQAATRWALECPRADLRVYPLNHFDIYVGEGFERAVADQTAFLRRATARSPIAESRLSPRISA